MTQVGGRRSRAPLAAGDVGRSRSVRGLAPGGAPLQHGPAVRSVCLYTCSAAPSGMGVHVLALAGELVARGVEVLVAYWPAAQAEPLMSRAAHLGAAVVRTPHPRDPAYGRELEATLRQAAPDVFHAHVGFGREDFGGARAARAAGVPATVQTLHLPWLLHGERKRASFRSSIDAVDRLITVSDAQRETYLRLGVAPDHVVTVPNGVVPRGRAPGRAEALRRLDLPEDAVVAMTVGRLAVQKGHRHLLDALPTLVERHPRLRVVVVGEGHLRESLQAQADRLGLGEAVRLVGHRADARELLDAADVFVLPSLQEGMPMAALEAMEAGCPVVATRVIGTAEVVVDGLTGRLVRAADPEALTQALHEVLTDEVRRRAQGAAGRELFWRRFTAARMTTDTLDVYDDVLRRVAGVRPLLPGAPEDALGAVATR